MKKYPLLIVVLFSAVWALYSQPIRVNPTGVNVNSQNPTVAFLTFGQIPPGYVPAEAMWCGRLIPAPAPAIGLRCDPDTIYGSLPTRYDLSQPSGNLGLTDIMSIPPSVVRRAYQEALEGGSAGFFYVRRFTSASGQPDQYVSVTCRMTGGGARVPFALTNVELRTPSGGPILFVNPEEKFPNVTAEIQYNGTGRLKGRWELVRPGEEQPEEFDLLTEGSLPIEDRTRQRRFLQVARFNHFLPPGGKFALPLEVQQRLPIDAEGQYLLLLRIEAVDDKESDSDLRVIGVGDKVVHSGAVAGFPMPTLKFFVSGKRSASTWEATSLAGPADQAVVNSDQPLVFHWRELPSAVVYRLEIFGEQKVRIMSAILLSPTAVYSAPSWFRSRFTGKSLTWHVVALDGSGNAISTTEQRSIRVQ